MEQSLSHSHWDRIGTKPHLGFCLPLSSLWSANSCGIGEFLDLIPLVTFAKKVGFDVIQLLPLNDSGLDPSPYNAMSSIALHPIYLSLHALPYLDDPALIHKIQELQELNLAEEVLFQRVYTSKYYLLVLYFDKYKEKILSSPDYKTFLETAPWLRRYALFKVLQEKMEQVDLRLWPDELKYLDDGLFATVMAAHEKEVSFHMALQYLCFLQLSQVKKHAEETGVLLK